MLNIAICDDMEMDRKHIEGLIQDYCTSLNCEISIMTFSSGEEINKHYIYENSRFDIIFLDIYMGGDNGIKTAQMIREVDMLVKIIFITTSVEHALDSFSVFPFNYLVKPIKKEIFNKVFENAILTIDKEKQKSITVKMDDQIHTIFYKDIKYLDSAGKKINIHTKNTIIHFYSKLDDVEAAIGDERFLRCHKSFLVNMDFISSVEDYSFILMDRIEVPIKQRAYANIKRRYYTYLTNKMI